MKHSFLTFVVLVTNKKGISFRLKRLTASIEPWITLSSMCIVPLKSIKRPRGLLTRAITEKKKRIFFLFFECFYFWFVFINDLATEKLDCFKRNLWLNSLNLPKLSEQPIFAFQWFGTFWKKLVTCLIFSVVTVSQFFWPPKQLPTLPANRRRKNFWFLKFFENSKISLQSDQTRKKSKMGSNAPCKRCLVIPGPGKCLSKLFKMKPMLHWSQKLH